MTRSALGTLTLAALESDAATPIYFVELGPFNHVSPEVTEYLHSGLGTINWYVTNPSIDWTGVGSLFEIGSVKEAEGLSPHAIRLGLNAADADMLSIVHEAIYFRRPCKVYLGALTNGLLVEDPGLIFSGFIEDIDTVMGGGEDRIELIAESELILFKRSRDVRFSDNQLQTEYAGDLGLQYLEDVKNKKITWRGRTNPLGSEGGSGNSPDRGWNGDQNER